MKFVKGEVVQFVEGHKWCGCLAYVDSFKFVDNDILWMLAVPVPTPDGVSTAYIYSRQKNKEFESLSIKKDMHKGGNFKMVALPLLLPEGFYDEE